MSKPAAELFDAYRDRSTELLYEWNRDWERKHGNKFYATPNGHETYKFQIGQTVTATGKGTIKAGVSFKIEQRMKDNGFCQYYGAGMWHRQNDIA
jgi:hypothetical protein